MGPPVVVAAEPFPQTRPQRVHGGVLEQIDLLVFHAPPQPLDEDVVHPAPAAVHAVLDAETGQFPGPFGEGELAALIGVEDLGNATGGGQGVFQGFQAEAGFHGVGNGPAQHLARCPVHHRAQVVVAAGHRHVGDVGAPDLIGPGDRQVPQQVGIFTVAVVRDAGARLAPDRLVADLAEQPLQALAVDFHAVIVPEDGHQAAASQAEIDHVDFVQQALDAEVFGVPGHGLVVHRGPGNA